MRCLLAGLLALFVMAPVVMAPAFAAPRAPDITSDTTALRWINAYRSKPEPLLVPGVMISLSKIGALVDPERCNAYVGFFAGVLGANPAFAGKLIEQSLAMQAQDRWFIVRAVAYSGLPNWKALLREFADRMPMRRVMIEKYLVGKMPTLDSLVVAPEPTAMQRFTAHFKAKDKDAEARRKRELEPSPEVLDILWGYYFATGSYGPVMHIIELLPWASDHDDAERLTIGNMAKFTLASNAAHDMVLLDMVRSSSKARNQPKTTVTALNEITDAAETVDIARIRKEALGAIAEVQRKGPAYKRDVSWWGYVGQSAIAAGCLAAAVASYTAAGLPCVIGGSSASAALNFWNNQP